MQKLVEGLHKFQSEFCQTNQSLFERLSKGQAPQALFISCSDSRVIPNLITQTGPGDLFVVRNAGNIIPPHGAGGLGETASIEFAVTALGVKDIVVCGHTLCGAMKGLLDLDNLTNMPAVKAWLGHAESTRRIVLENYKHLEGNARLTATAQENVLVQIENLRTHPAVRSKLVRGEVAIHGWVYKTETGEVFAYEQARGQFVPFGSAERTASPTSGIEQRIAS
ncbi:MAG: carbonic anhydrase [Polyangiaceae bacterium]|nr:carbonic anhydrase [Polyangiaceae bacterium]